MRIPVLFLVSFLLLMAGCSQPPAATKPPPPTAAEKLVVAGSGSNLAITEKLADAYNKTSAVKVEVPASLGSDGAINAVTAGELSLGLISRPLTAQEKGRGLKELPYARVAVVFTANSSVPDGNISASDVLEAIRGSKKTWSDGTKIYVITREKGDSTNMVLYDSIPGFREALAEAYDAKRWQVVYIADEAVDAVRRTPSSFCPLNSTQITVNPSDLKALSFDGVAPTGANIKNGSYKLVKDLSFVYKGELSKPAEAFVNFVFAEAGRQVTAQWGAVPLGR